MLICFPASSDLRFDGEELGEDVDYVCTVHMISRQITQDDPKLLVKETSKNAVITQVMHCVKEGWPNQCSEELQDYKKLENSLSTEHGFLFYGSRVFSCHCWTRCSLDTLECRG